ncbi:MAG TPA: nucleotidyltransferase domain-containing protein [Phycisphaerae bacterium]
MALLSKHPQLAEAVRRIVAVLDPDRILLFGSQARGDPRSESDYDLLVVKDTRERILALERKTYRALVGIPAPVDILIETPGQLERLKDAPHLAFRSALMQGVVIYERLDHRTT